MATSSLGRWLAGAMLFGSLGTANAAIVTLDPFAQFVNQGQTFSLQLSVAFEEATVGGSLDLFYDASLLGFVDFEFDEDFIDNVADPAFSREPDDCFASGAPFGGCALGDGELNAIAFGSFDGIHGIHVVGTIVFTALGAGTVDLSLAINDWPFEGFYSAVTGLEIPVELRDAQVYIEAIPLPAGVWLLVSALGAAGLLRRRR